MPVWSSTVARTGDGALTVGGLDVRSLAAEHGTPLYVVDEADFRARARAFREHFGAAFARHGAQCDVFYASKALLTSQIAAWVLDEGLGVDVASGGELELALRGGVPGERITFHGNNKSDAELTRALEAGVGRIVVDSFTEIEVLGALAEAAGALAPVLVRVTTGVHAGGHEYIATSHEDQKFGLSLATGAAFEALRAVHASPHLELRGIHTHIGSQILSIDSFKESAERMLRLRADFAAETGYEMPEVDLGGGYAIAYTPESEAMDVEKASLEIADVVAQGVDAAGGGWPHISIEPGRAIAGPAGMTVYTVGVTKDVALDGGGTRHYVAVDGGMSDNMRTITYGAEYTAALASRASDAPAVLSRVVGKHCESGDIVVRDVDLPADIARGDLLAVPATGAYGRVMASNYNSILRPAVVAVRDGQSRVLIRRDTLEDLLGWDVAP
ncbi:diaminopimelate decarboxylase [Demequina sp. TTPB684]|uniref:diaminopimelate decarboxylase n=1 Tax=unclassified Demequina TaxID=2620311 RepID=UPI001CF468C9|nr:diaminopimelate decarboxylase [Demequina sp. TMPB413]MCB2411864.1 diaminopimelate decarboxylase [Demequina sp. TTPB684]UPU88618.1 diaminopimelate decarboxylase [Demequina sp. TMPB413]